MEQRMQLLSSRALHFDWVDKACTHTAKDEDLRFKGAFCTFEFGP